MISVDYIMNAIEHSKVRLPFFLYTLYIHRYVMYAWVEIATTQDMIHIIQEQNISLRLAGQGPCILTRRKKACTLVELVYDLCKKYK